MYFLCFITICTVYDVTFVCYNYIYCIINLYFSPDKECASKLQMISSFLKYKMRFITVLNFYWDQRVNSSGLCDQSIVNFEFSVSVKLSKIKASFILCKENFKYSDYNRQLNRQLVRRFNDCTARSNQ